MPQLRMIDGVEITSEEKVKSENLHGFDTQDREIIFKSLLPQEVYIDRRIGTIDDVPGESDNEGDLPYNSNVISGGAHHGRNRSSTSKNVSMLSGPVSKS